MKKALMLLALTFALAAPGAAEEGLLEQDIEQAVAIGTRAKGAQRGLVLRDSGQSWARALASMNGQPSNLSTGFWLEAWTPLSWIEQQASNAAKRYHPLTPEDVTPEMRQPVFRVVVHPDVPTMVTASGMAGTSSVEHVVLRCAQRQRVVQPLAVEPFSEEAANAMGGRVEFAGVIATFPLDALAELRKPNSEFFITVIGATGEEKNFKVKRKHFAALR